MNKKGSYGLGLFVFFFSLMITTAIMFFFLTAFPAVLETYGIETAKHINQGMIDSGVSNPSSQASIEAIADDYKQIYKIADYMFILFIVGVFVSSVISSVMAQRQGIFSFFGFMTVGSVILIFLLTYAVAISDWILYEVTLGILSITIDTPFAFWFFEYSLYIGTIWYILLLVINIIDIRAIGSRFTFVNRDDDRRFEE
jgi:hypothetical protein